MMIDSRFIKSPRNLQYGVSCPFVELSSYAPGGRNFPELTKCERLPFWQGGGMMIGGGTVTVTDTNIYSNDAGQVCSALAFGTFLALASDAPGGRNPPELTKCEHIPCLAGWGGAHPGWYSDSNGHQHLLQQCQQRMRLLLEPSWYFLPTPPAEETSLNILLMNDD